MRAFTFACIPLGLIAAAVTAKQYPYTPTVQIPLYGVSANPQQQPAAQDDLGDRLKRIEEKLDKILKLVEDEATGDPPAAGQPPAALISGATACASCHNPNVAGDKGGGFALFTAEGKFANLNPRQLAQVRKRLATTDPSFQMPPPTSGVQLTPAEQAALVAAFAEPKKEQDP